MLILCPMQAALILTAAVSGVWSQDLGSGFTLRFVRMCVKPEFTRELAVDEGAAEIVCASACSKLGGSCRGFQLTGAEGSGSGGRCRALVFDRCSHMVRTDCSQFAWIYVRNQAGLPDGQICPDGFGSGYFGSNYKMISATSWTDGLAKCSSQPGLTKFADAMDGNETQHLHWIKANVNGGSSYFIGGWRIGGLNSNPWFWQACNISYKGDTWAAGQPSLVTGENYLFISSGSGSGIDDALSIQGAVLCECIDPFV